MTFENPCRSNPTGFQDLRQERKHPGRIILARGHHGSVDLTTLIIPSFMGYPLKEGKVQMLCLSENMTG